MTTALLTQLRQQKPLIHCMTNIVVANFQANGLLALGASPVMADAIEEAADIAKIASCTVLNIGTLKSATIDAMLVAGTAANAHHVPVILDPVGAGATPFRRSKTLELLNAIDVALIRCNAGELAAIAGVAWQAKGVDAGEGTVDIETVAKQVAQTYQCIVAVTGKEDYVTDGKRQIRITGGHSMMSNVTGTGCLLSSVAGAFIATDKEQPFEATVTALQFYKLVGEIAITHAKGPGDYAVHFVNALHNITEKQLFEKLKMEGINDDNSSVNNCRL